MLTRDFLIEIIWHIHNVQQKVVNSGFLFIFITHKLWEHLVRGFAIQSYFNDYDVTT